MLLFILICVLVLFRWYIFGRFLGVKNMYLFDAVMFVAIAASNFAAKASGDVWQLVNYACGCLCIYWSYQAGKQYLHFDEVNNEKTKSDSGTT